MEKAVDEVISRLAEIEDTANRMNEAVEVRKKEISADKNEICSDSGSWRETCWLWWSYFGSVEIYS